MTLRFLFIGLLLQATILSAAPPAWWSEENTRIVEPGAPSGPAANYAPANLGQLKHLATQAKEYMDVHLPGGSGPAVAALVTSFGTNLTPAQREANYAPVNLGQLKAITKPFYDRLLACGYGTRANLIARGYPASWTANYPWAASTPLSENYAPANLGQLKLVFSFDLTAPPGQLPAWWIAYYFPGQLGIIPSGDEDSDGLSNLDEYLNQTKPNNPDSDNDGMKDGYEAANGLNANLNDAGGDKDNDGTLNKDDARPNAPGVGALTIIITTPANAGTY